jgi:hypothetical protein
MAKNKKLTLYVDADVIERAKKYALEQQTSVSDMVEQYLDDVSQTKQGEGEQTQVSIPPSFIQFYGVISLPADYDEKKDAMEQRSQKHR